ncbi:hypothetical protein [Aeromonas sp. L_1B5_3]|uniref:hypothetical protein n=1 Tax=Aeromonas sp. L_1B5_3 TaxID=1588629 RepID=UPI0005B6DA0F|nr:hypothetical protein [Aeromonas sp. L_1B5_3]KIQ79260.1 hypothetical protein RW26_15530 [Aeromonas sp. L_1B5_3]
MIYLAWTKCPAPTDAVREDSPSIESGILKVLASNKELGFLSVFDSDEERAKFIEQMQGNSIAVTPDQARHLMGLGKQDFKTLVVFLQGGDQ